MTRSNVGVILTLNEESQVVGAIESLKWCDRIYVVDSGSTDATVELSRAHGATVLTHRQEGPFLISEQRNWAIAQVGSDGDVVFFLDADERCTESLATEIAGLGGKPDYAAYYAAPAFHFFGTWLRRTSGYPNWHPRLVIVGRGVNFDGGVWEDFGRGVDAGRLASPYLHMTNSKGLSEWMEKHDRYAQWEARRIVESKSAGREVRRATGRQIRYRLGPLRKFASLFHLAVLRGGVLDGPNGWAYLRRMYLYELMIDAHVKERRHLNNGGEL